MAVVDLPPVHSRTRQDAVDDSNPRVGSFRSLMYEITEQLPRPPITDLNTLADQVLDAILAADREFLDVAVAGLDALIVDCRRGRRSSDVDVTVARLDTLLLMASGARDRTVTDAAVRMLRPGRNAYKMLSALRGRAGVARAEILATLGIDAGQASRLAMSLSDERLLAQAKIGREVYYDITPYGEDALAAADASHVKKSPKRPKKKHLATGAATVLYESTQDPFDLTQVAVQDALGQAGHPAVRSRALFVALAAIRPEAITDRLFAWNSLAAKVAPERFEIRLPSLERAEESLHQLSWDILTKEIPAATKARDQWAGAEPAWDGWAMVHGRQGRRGVVLIEAKSQVEELRTRPVGGQRAHDVADFDELLAKTGEALGATERWRTWPNYADVAVRFAFLHHLRTHNVQAWWLNLCFVDPYRLVDRLPKSPQAWAKQGKVLRNDLKLSEEHELTDYVWNSVQPVSRGVLSAAS